MATYLGIRSFSSVHLTCPNDFVCGYATNNMHHNRRGCAPIYVEPEVLRDLAIKTLDKIKDPEMGPKWVHDSNLYLTRNGFFSYGMTREGSVKVHTQKAILFLTNLVWSPRPEVPLEEQRLQQRLGRARRQLVVSLLAHAWLWGRPKVLDNQGNPKSFEERWVLSPQMILDFLDGVRTLKTTCTDEDVRQLIEGVPKIPLHKDRSKWSVTGLVACLRWDKCHDGHNGGPWCSCRLKKEDSPPPYNDVFVSQGSCRLKKEDSPPPYDNVFVTQGANLDVVRRFPQDKGQV